MQLKNYLKYSGIWVSLAVNPYHWRFHKEFNKPNDMDPSMYSLYLTLGPISIRFVIDDGSW